MLSYQVLNYYKFINEELNKFKDVLNPILEWSKTFLEYDTQTLTKILKSNTISGSDGYRYVIQDGKIKLTFGESVKNMKNVFSSYIIFKSFGEFKQRIDYYRKENNITTSDFIQKLIEITDNLFQIYEEFQKDDTNQLKLINFANELIKYNEVLENSIEMYSDFGKLYSEDDNKYDSNQVLCIQLLNEEFSMQQFGAILEEIEEIYIELNNLIYINKNQINISKLKIVKIESGSLFSKVAGNSATIKFIKDILRKIIVAVQKDYEIEQRVITHQKLSNSLKQDIELMKLLEDCGCDTKSSKSLIEKTFNIIAKNGLDIAQSSGNIKIDEEEFNMKESIKQRFLNECNRKLLSSGKEEGNKNE